jgi:ABC-type Fe3+/spermidine/putrescine transport system ATPase subunit
MGVSSRTALYPHMTVYQNLAFGLENVARPRAEIDSKVDAAARMLQLDALLHAASDAALRRPATARGDRARDRAQSEGVPVRRAAVQISTPSCACRCARS